MSHSQEIKIICGNRTYRYPHTRAGARRALLHNHKYHRFHTNCTMVFPKGGVSYG